MARRAASRRRQAGVALLAMLAVAVLVFAYLLVNRLHAASQFVAIDRDHNAKVLNQAKQALIGYVAHRAALASEENPGRLPCPEAGAYFGNPAQEGIAAGNCTLPAVGRLPWRTLGLNKLVDANAEPLWYVVSPGWALPTVTSTLTINSDSVGQLTVDGVANNAVALIIAPGSAMVVQAGGPCTAWVQTRALTGAPNARNYLECGNATGSLITSAPGRTFNDQVLRVTAADIIAPLEAAIAHRVKREIVPALRGVYSSAQWGGNPLFPYPALFSDPGTYPGTSNCLTAPFSGPVNSNCFKGVAATSNSDMPQGLLPFTSSNPACGGGARCDPNFVTWNTGVGPSVTATGGGTILLSSCSFPDSATVRCTGVYAGIGTVSLHMSAQASNVALALRTLAPANMSVEYGVLTYGPPQPGDAASGSFNVDGSANVTLRADVPGLVDGLGLPLNVQFRLTADLGVLADHALLDQANTTTGWFVRNEWFRLVYYAVSLANTAWAPFGCTTGSNCLSLNNPAPSQNNRAILILAGRSINGSARPSGTLANYLEFGNNDGDSLYEQNPVSRVVNAALKAPFNDRVVVVDSN